MNILALLSLLASAVGTGAKIYKNKKAEEYQEDVKDQQDRDIEKQYQAQRKRALAAAIGSRNVDMPQRPEAALEPPDLSGADTVEGVSGFVGNAAGSLSGKYGDIKAPVGMSGASGGAINPTGTSTGFPQEPMQYDAVTPSQTAEPMALSSADMGSDIGSQYNYDPTKRRLALQSRINGMG